MNWIQLVIFWLVVVIAFIVPIAIISKYKMTFIDFILLVLGSWISIQVLNGIITFYAS